MSKTMFSTEKIIINAVLQWKTQFLSGETEILRRKTMFSAEKIL